MTLRISRKHRDLLVEWEQEAGNQECCGLMLGQDDKVGELVLCANVAADPQRHFEIDPAALIERHRQQRSGGTPVLGYFHSHPNGLARPSSDDIAKAASDGRYWLIIATGELTVWRLRARDNLADEFESIPILVEG